MVSQSAVASRGRLAAGISASRERLIKLCCQLVRVDSQNPPGDTSALADVVCTWIGAREDVEISRIVTQAAVTNLIIRLRTPRPGRRLVFNGHLDTFTIGDSAAWSAPPLSGVVMNGKIMGRGVSDMKAGLAAAMIAFDLLHSLRHHLSGELVLVFVGDEETGGTWGTQFLLERVPEARGDAMLSGDAGSPMVARFGEKGQMWVELRAAGKAAHGAHVHLGRNAIEDLMRAVQSILAIADVPVSMPWAIEDAILAAQDVSETLSGAGESRVLRSVTANVGTIQGGAAVNLVPDKAVARIDLRFPPGISCSEMRDKARAAIREFDNVELDVIGQCEPNWTDPAHELVRLVCSCAHNVVGKPVVSNMRIGFSDARFYRAAGIPSVTYGPTPHNMGGSDEYVLVEDLFAVAAVHALTAFDYLTAESSVVAGS